MTDPMPEDGARELRQTITDATERMVDLDHDLTAILITHPDARSRLLNAMDADNLRAVLQLVLSWVDEFRNLRAADAIFNDLALRAVVALGTGPEAIAKLTEPTHPDEPTA